LKCRNKDLISHDFYLDDLGYGDIEVPEQDKKNANFLVQEE
jgi:hypothetical protein